MKGRTFSFELKNRWKGLTIFLVIVIIFMAGYIQIFPSISKPFEEDLEGSEYVDIEVDEDAEVIRLDWKELDDASNYTLKVNVVSQMVQPIDSIEGIQDNSYEYPMRKEDGEMTELYFAVVGVYEDSTEEFVGMSTNTERRNPFEELMGFDWTDIGDFVSMLYDMWFVLLVGLYLGYISVNSITSEFEEKRMDILLSTSLSRKQFLLEKFSALSFYTLMLLLTTALAMILSVYSVGESSSLSPYQIFLSMIISLPLFLVIIAFSFLVSVRFKSSRIAVGLTFFFIFVNYAVHLVADMAETLEVVKSYSLMTYWDFNSVLSDSVVNFVDIGLLSMIALILFVLAVFVFERSDIPA